MSDAIDRRAFLGGAAAAGAVAAATATPLTARALAPARPAPASGEALPAPASAQSAADADWHIDDMWGHTPRYAHPIPHSPMGTSPVEWEHVEPIDRFLVS